MEKDQQELNKFLEEQVEWCKMQDAILEEIENKLYEMKELAEYAYSHEPTPIDINRLNNQINTLKLQVQSLEQQLQSNVN